MRVFLESSTNQPNREKYKILFCYDSLGRLVEEKYYDFSRDVNRILQGYVRNTEYTLSHTAVNFSTGYIFEKGIYLYRMNSDSVVAEQHYHASYDSVNHVMNYKLYKEFDFENDNDLK